MSPSVDELSARPPASVPLVNLVTGEVLSINSVRAYLSDAAISSMTARHDWVCSRGHDAVRGERCSACRDEMSIELAELRTGARIRARDGRE